jgi:hypothetical protein
MLTPAEGLGDVKMFTPAEGLGAVKTLAKEGRSSRIRRSLTADAPAPMRPLRRQRTRAAFLTAPCAHSALLV